MSIHYVSNEDGSRCLVLVLHSLAVLPVSIEISRTVQVPNDKDSRHQTSFAYWTTLDQIQVAIASMKAAVG